MTTLSDLCSLIRSKNAGPFVLTFDLMFSSKENYERARRRCPLKPERVARIYGVRAADVCVFFCDNACAIKISIPRPVVQCDPGDNDCYGGQQYVPILEMRVRDGVGGLPGALRDVLVRVARLRRADRAGRDPAR
jgi:hypothetical protein